MPKTKSKETEISYGCQQILLHPDIHLKGIMEFICEESNKLYNCATYYARQIFFKTREYVAKFDLNNQMKTNKHFQVLYSQVAQQTCQAVAEAFKSYKEIANRARAGDLNQRPKPPGYRKGGLYTVSYPKQALKLVEGKLRLPLGSLVKTWFKIDSFKIPFPSNLDFDSIKEVRILPRNRCFYAEFVYTTKTEKPQLDSGLVLGIDHGIDNWLTCISNAGTGFIIDGRKVKAMNQWYNKQIAKYKENRPQGFWSNRLAHVTERRNRQMRDAINKAARTVINHCLSKNIGVVVFGWNQGQKQELNLGSKTNQKFVQVPTAKLKARIQQLSSQYGIKFIETEEAYTSKASFLDQDSLPKHGEKPDDWEPSGKRIKRGLYRSKNGTLLNADCNGAGNIVRKVSRTLALQAKELSRVSLTTPIRIQLWMPAKKVKRDDFSLPLNNA